MSTYVDIFVLYNIQRIQLVFVIFFTNYTKLNIYFLQMHFFKFKI